jgi:hypothetical protein
MFSLPDISAAFYNLYLKVTIQVEVTKICLSRTLKAHPLSPKMVGGRITA